MRSQTLGHAIALEATAGLANREAKVDQAVDTWASAAAKDDSAVAQLVQSAKVMIANSGFDQKTRNAKAEKAVAQIVEAAIHGNIERNPQATRAALIARYGIDPAEPPKPEEQPAAQVVGGVPAGVAPGVAKFSNAIAQNATAKGVDPSIMAWQLDKESKGNPNARNDADIRVTGSPSIGIAQFQPGTAKRYGIDPTKPEEAIKGQAAYMSDLLKMFGGDYQKALAGYNWGEGNVQKAIAKYGDQWFQHSPKSTQDYVTYIQTNAAKTPAGGGRGTVNPPTVTPDAGQPAPEPAPAFSPELKSLVDQLPADKLPAYISAATTAAHQQQALVKSSVAQLEGDHVTAFMNGQTVDKPLTQDDYVKAYGATEGPQRFAQYTAIQQLGHDMNSMKAMPPAQISALIDSYRRDADPNKPGYELATKRLNTLVEAADRINQARQSDPIAYAMQTNLGGAKPLNFDDPKQFGVELARRQGVASTMQSTYGAPYTLLSKAEAQTLAAGFDKMTTEQKLGYLKTIKSSLSDPAAYRAVMGQVAPDSPVTAMAGMILSKQSPMVIRNTFTPDQWLQQRDVAGQILEGEALLNPSKSAKAGDGKGKEFPMPKEQDLRDQFTSAVGKAFAGDPRGADFAFQAVKAYYAGASARAGDVSGQTDSGRLKEAIIAVTGGVSDINGKGEVVRPWGMSERDFKDKSAAAFTKAMAANGYTGSQLDQFGAYGLESAGDSKYLLKSGTGYLVGRDGRPVVLDLTPAPDLSWQIPVENARAPAGQQTSGGRGWTGTIVQEHQAKPNTQQPKTK